MSNVKNEIMCFGQNKKCKTRVNPTDIQEKITRCATCNSNMHWAKRYPHKQNADSVNTTETVAENDDNLLYNEEFNSISMTLDEYGILISEMETNKTIDISCRKTVSGKAFLNFIFYLEELAQF